MSILTVICHSCDIEIENRRSHLLYHRLEDPHQGRVLYWVLVIIGNWKGLSIAGATWAPPPASARNPDFSLLFYNCWIHCGLLIESHLPEMRAGVTPEEDPSSFRVDLRVDPSGPCPHCLPVSLCCAQLGVHKTTFLVVILPAKVWKLARPEIYVLGWANKPCFFNYFRTLQRPLSSATILFPGRCMVSLTPCTRW